MLLKYGGTDCVPELTTIWDKPWGARGSVEEPQQRFYEETKRIAGSNWYQIAQNRTQWSNIREAYG